MNDECRKAAAVGDEEYRSPRPGHSGERRANGRMDPSSRTPGGVESDCKGGMELGEGYDCAFICSGVHAPRVGRIDDRRFAMIEVRVMS